MLTYPCPVVPERKTAGEAGFCAAEIGDGARMPVSVVYKDGVVTIVRGEGRSGVDEIPHFSIGSRRALTLSLVQAFLAYKTIESE
jgi:hypothetical protein